MIVFVIGGMTYSEMREAYVMGQKKNKEIYIGAFRDMTATHLVSWIGY